MAASRFSHPAALPVSPWGDRGRRARVGLLGGSFNPAHGGHRHISLEALKRLRLDEVWWLVSPQNPLKAPAGMAPLAARVESARAVVAGHPRVRVLTLETALGTRYTVETLARLRQRFPQVRFVWLMGADNLAQLPRWRWWQRILHGVAVAVLDRYPYSESVLHGVAAQRYRRARKASRAAGHLPLCHPPAWVFLPIRRHPASATALRQQRDWPVDWP